MEKTTIYLDKDIKMHLLEMVADISKRQGKRAAMSDIIRDALREYFERQEQEKVKEDDRYE
jgi:metal-responsive CopG/Arc/MetJ family transcriptional regulator